MSIFVSATPVAIAIGSNLGDSKAIVDAAIERLARTPKIRLDAYSHQYQTVAVGPPQPDYINACALLTTTLEPLELLQTLLTIEAQFGRIRRERWGARSLDLDLLLYGDVILDLPQLQIPHPRMIDRAFVLVPLAEIAPDWIEPVSGQSIATLAQAVDCSGVHLAQPQPLTPNS
ncbi:2-amino-4-hydroxy-6-hydroxymethyldihydropteridine diphosphokinase [Microcoleus sp. FACHB-1515]|uniref:2-amino-4-hydroxy-6- hydroxymethyldihydropteridine diphosphokinase n=1 Tax=Cyanophyceae TaxID=3028117 RepID=UPI0018EF9448|nr:2-amino-4-hydroxy-6-hydroxymethyldihydropteridine diphosphokinase [Microcoleus sp. FACHB-1515]